jgi:hypothetical protein
MIFPGTIENTATDKMEVRDVGDAFFEHCTYGHDGYFAAC